MSVLVFFSWILKSSDNSHDYLISSSNKDSQSNNPHPNFKYNLFRQSFKSPLPFYCHLLIHFQRQEPKNKRQKTEASEQRSWHALCLSTTGIWIQVFLSSGLQQFQLMSLLIRLSTSLGVLRVLVVFGVPFSEASMEIW